MFIVRPVLGWASEFAFESNFVSRANLYEDGGGGFGVGSTLGCCESRAARKWVDAGVGRRESKLMRKCARNGQESRGAGVAAHRDTTFCSPLAGAVACCELSSARDYLETAWKRLGQGPICRFADLPIRRSADSPIRRSADSPIRRSDHSAPPRYSDSTMWRFDDVATWEAEEASVISQVHQFFASARGSASVAPQLSAVPGNLARANVSRETFQYELRLRQWAISHR